MKEKIKENNHQENDPVLTKPTQEEWEKVFAQREEFLGVKMTTKQKEGWQRGTIAEAQKAWELRKDLQRIYDKSQISRELARCLKHYLQPDYENIEYELSNNGCGNLLADIAKELKKYGEHYSLEKLAERIGEGYYGEWCHEWDPN